ncbi:MAG: transporter substrate-binding domain-containing protein [Hyphomicrobiales bacterium]|nr:transporter substrate-binding domain-containing protein [Hyphomicrobiales bacterium]MDE2016708.1 transporter substrate-binding domain-containing protein [Hyphomicrobiales bacterium]
MDPDGTLAGFNVDVARAICAELKVACTVQARPFPALLDALRTGKGDAVIASQSIPERAPPGILFTRPIYLTPGRFAVRKGAPAPTDMRGTTIGVMAGGAHAAFVAAYFRRSIVTTFAGAPDLEAALKSGNVDAIFSDGPSLAAWLASAGSSDCCAFAGGPYLEPRYFGHGAGIAVRRDDRSLAASFDRALWVLEGDGRLSEIERKYFPVPFQ